MRRADLTGQQFGSWTVLSYAGDRGWACECVCGRQKVVNTGNLVNGYSRQCRQCSGVNARSGRAVFNTVFGEYQRNARKRHLSWCLTEDDFTRLTQSDCYYCGDPPSKVRTKEHCYGTYVCNGIDRLDNEQGYSIDNCVPCCETCNRMKMALNVNTFLVQVSRIARNHSFNNTENGLEA